MSQITNSDENLRKLMQTETNSYSYSVKITYVDFDGKERDFPILSPVEAKDELDLKLTLKKFAAYHYDKCVNGEAKKLPADDCSFISSCDISYELLDKLLDKLQHDKKFNEFYNSFKLEIDAKPTNLNYPIIPDNWSDSHPEFNLPS